MSTATLPKWLQPAFKALEKDLLARAKTECVEVGLKAAWEHEQKAGQPGLGLEPWRRERVTQLAVAWILSVVFVRTLEKGGYVDPRAADASADALRAAKARLVDPDQPSRVSKFQPYLPTEIEHGFIACETMNVGGANAGLVDWKRGVAN